MGRRGPGARPKATKPPGASTRRQRFPWHAKGLERAERVIKFVQYLPVTKGRRAGKRMRLLPEQREFVEAVYNDDVPVRIGVLSMPRGNGKTGLVAALALCHLVGPEAEPRGEIVSCAVDREQASIVFEEMAAILLATPALGDRCNIRRWHKRIEVDEGDGAGSVYNAMSADARKAHGLAPSVWIYDELGQARDSEMLQNLRTAQGKRARSLGLVISTQAPRDDHPMSQLVDEGLKDANPSIYVKLIAVPADADPFDPGMLLACNPGVAGGFLDADVLLEQAQQARRMPSFEAAFRNLRANQRVVTEGAFISPAVWNACARAPLEEVLASNPVYAGLDLSARTDLTALVYGAQHEGAWHVRAEFFAPREGLHDRALRDRVPYDVWARDGVLTLCDGYSVAYELVAERLAELAEQYDVKAIAYDRWRIDVLKKELSRLGVELPLVPFGQGFRDFSPALDALEEELLNGRLRHGGNPLLTWCAANAIIASDPAGNRKLDKGRSFQRIDGLVALTMALGVVPKEPEVEPAPKYQVLRARL